MIMDFIALAERIDRLPPEQQAIAQPVAHALAVQSAFQAYHQNLQQLRSMDTAQSHSTPVINAFVERFNAFLDKEIAALFNEPDPSADIVDVPFREVAPEPIEVALDDAHLEGANP